MEYAMACLFKRLGAMILASSLLIVSAQQPAVAWTRTGHAAIGFVAEAKLKTDNWAVWKKLAALLGTANLYDEDIAGWADDMRGNYPDVAHSVRIPVLDVVPAASVPPACQPAQCHVRRQSDRLLFRDP